jgi:hypothetical protein
MSDCRKTKIVIFCIICSVLGFYSAKLLFSHIANTQNINDAASRPRLAAAKPATAASSPLPQALPPVPAAAKTAKKTSSAETITPPRPAFVLNGIVISPGSNYALVNNKIVKEGDKIEGVTVVRITKDSVELKDGDTAFKISPNTKLF